MQPGCTTSRFEIIGSGAEADRSVMAREVRQGLTAAMKYLPSTYFYDNTGSELFERICTLPEYYLTRTELGLLKQVSAGIMGTMTSGNLVELGSGANWKIRTLLDAANGNRSRIRYVPFDVCRAAIEQAGRDLLARFPDLTVRGIVADLHRDVRLLAGLSPKLIVFFGSTLGNFGADEGRSLLNNLAASMDPGDRFVVGVDLVKDRTVLEAAYNDSQGITARFNLNILAVLNRDLDADFDISQFEHVAFYDEERERVEMHLRAQQDMNVPVRHLGLHIPIRRGESIRTEICRKFRREGIDAMAREAGFRIAAWHTDEREWFGLAEMVLMNRP